MSPDTKKRPYPTSVYPEHPPGSRRLVRIDDIALTLGDRLAVAASSLFIVGSIAWVPLLYAWSIRRWQRIPKTDTRRRRLYLALLLSSAALLAVGPHRSPRVGQWLKVRQWKLWRSWMKFIAFEVIADQTSPINVDKEQAILAFVPHGIFPFGLAFGVLPELAQKAFGVVQPVVATAIELFPFVRDLLKWVQAVDASKPAVDAALQNGCRLGLNPGGIAEIFLGYNPSASAPPDTEYSIVRRGFLRMAAKHGLAVVPIYCFGATKMMRRLNLPLLEKLSLLLRVSLCIFYGVWGLPIPFRQRLLYIVGDPIYPSTHGGSMDDEAVIDDMHQRFCEELRRIFDRHKTAYGWGHKNLEIIRR